jgi:hypothetical protein
MVGVRERISHRLNDVLVACIRCLLTDILGSVCIYFDG